MARRSEKVKVGIYKVDAIDTTGAGDSYAAGFWAWNDWPLVQCAQLGSRVASEAVAQLERLCETCRSPMCCRDQRVVMRIGRYLDDRGMPSLGRLDQDGDMVCDPCGRRSFRSFKIWRDCSSGTCVFRHRCFHLKLVNWLQHTNTSRRWGSCSKVPKIFLKPSTAVVGPWSPYKSLRIRPEWIRRLSWLLLLDEEPRGFRLKMPNTCWESMCE